jgi:SAM-dependent methyltransferase
MKNLVDSIKERLRREAFYPTWLGMLLSPTYIIRRGLLCSIREFAPLLQGDILDFGCGSKPYAPLFTSASNYLGVDVKISGHDHLDSKVDVFYDGTTLPFKDRQFSAVVAFEVFEHLFNLTHILRELHRVTMDAGYLLISIPFAWDEHEVPYDYARYTSFGITHCLNEHGYEVVQLRKTTTYVLAIFQIVIAYLIRTSPKTRILRWMRQVILVCPLTLLAFVFDFLLPKRFEYFCNCVVLAKKLES